jgi:MFS family permease
VSATVGLFLALAIILVTRLGLGETAFASWGWRIPFLASVALLAISLWIRLQLEESPLFRRLQEEGRTSRAPLSEAFGQWKNLRLVLIVLFGLLMGQGVVWYTAEFYTQLYLQRTASVPASTVNVLMLIVTAAAAPLHMFFAWISDFLGRKPVMLFGLGLAALSFVPGFEALTEAVNPQLTEAAHATPVTVFASPSDCSVQFDPIGKTKFTTSCDIAKGELADKGIPYSNLAASPGTIAEIHFGHHVVRSFDGAVLAPKALSAQRSAFHANLTKLLRDAGYPEQAEPARIEMRRAILWLLVFIIAASALYGPQAAALVELFPTRIRYSALSLPYHIGVGWFGGFLPAAAFAIVAQTGNIYAGLWYPVSIAAIGFVVALFLLPETRGRDLAA